MIFEFFIQMMCSDLGNFRKPVSIHSLICLPKFIIISWRMCSEALFHFLGLLGNKNTSVFRQVRNVCFPEIVGLLRREIRKRRTFQCRTFR